MCICKVSRWYGRLGNNFIQIQNALCYAMENKCHKIVLNSHTLLKSQNVEIKMSDVCLCNKIKLAAMFWTDVKLKKNFSYDEIKALVQSFIVPLLVFEIPEEGHDNHLYIHFRGGDVFGKWGVHSGYVQPPLEFYRKVISNGDYDKVIVVHEDFKNPCVKEIKNLHSNVEYQSSDVISDIKTLCKARHLAVGSGTFCKMVAILSKTLKHVHSPHFVVHFSNIQSDYLDILKYIIPNYIKAGSWNASPEQLNLMLTYRNNIQLDK